MIGLVWEKKRFMLRVLLVTELNHLCCVTALHATRSGTFVFLLPSNSIIACYLENADILPIKVNLPTGPVLDFVKRWILCKYEPVC